MGSVEWDATALGRSYGTDLVLLRVRFDDSKAGLALVDEWAASFRTAARPHGEVGVPQPIQLPDGSCVIAASKPRGRRAFLAMVTDLVDALEAGQVRASIAPTRNSYPAVTNPGIAFTSTTVSVSLPLRNEVRGGGVRLWSRDDVDPVALSAVTDHALAWCRLDGGAHYVQTPDTSFRMDADSRDATVRLGLREPRGRLWAVASTWPGETRVVALGPEGRVHFQFGTGPAAEPLDDPLDRVQRLLTDLAPWTTSGFALPSHERTTDTVQAISVSWKQRPDVPGHHIQTARRLEDQRVYDAFPVLYLGPGFESLVAETPSYDAVQVGAGRLLTHRRAGAWLRGDVDAISEREMARPECGDALLSEADILGEQAR